MAVFDLGTHSLKALIARVAGDGSYAVLEDIRVPMGLRDSPTVQGFLLPETRQTLLTAVETLSKQVPPGTIAEGAVAATSLLRNASNGREVFRSVLERLPFPGTILSGQDEGRLLFESAAHSLNLNPASFTLVDIGAGSVEIVAHRSAGSVEVSSLLLGARHLTDLFQKTDPLSPSDWNAMCEHIRTSLSRADTREKRGYPKDAVGSGGTFTTLANAHRTLHARIKPLHGYILHPAEILVLAERLAFAPQSKLRVWKGISPDRASILPAGACIAFCLIQELGLKSITVCNGGLRLGLLIDLIRRTTGREPVEESVPLRE